MVNMETKATAFSSALVKINEPPHSVAIQLKILTAVGMAMMTVLKAKNPSATRGKPAANMWCAQTPKDRKPIATVDQAMKE